MKSGKNHAQLRGILLTALAFCVMVLAVVLALGEVDDRNVNEQVSTLKEAVLRSTLTCYAVEGRYPANVEYLEQNYNIAYDRERFIVILDGFAQNILPDIRVLVQGGGIYEE